MNRPYELLLMLHSRRKCVTFISPELIRLLILRRIWSQLSSISTLPSSSPGRMIDDGSTTAGVSESGFRFFDVDVAAPVFPLVGGLCASLPFGSLGF